MKIATIGILAVPAIALFATAPAAAQSGFYARADLGASITTGTSGNILTGSGFGNDFGSTAVLSAGAGIYIPVPGWPFSLRADLTGGIRPGYEADHSGSLGTFTLTGRTKIDVTTVMGTLYADWPTGTPLTPYLGVGVGGAFVNLGTINYNFNGVPSASEAGTNQANFAWSVGFGAS